MNKLFSKLVMVLGALIVLSLGSTSVLADNLLIIPVAPRIVQPAGLGTVNTVLVLQTQGSATSGFGSVAYDPSDKAANRKGDLITGSQVIGGSNNQTYSTAQLGITSAGELCINMNINDPNKGGSNSGPVGPIILNTLVLNAYDAAGNTVFSAHLANALTLREATDNGNGTGKSDFAFALNDEAVRALNAAIAANPQLRLGLSASVTDASGGHESFFFCKGCNNPSAVPEPATMVLLGTGLAGVAGAVRKRRRGAKEIAENTES
jgi:PEP-CTERM motif